MRATMAAMMAVRITPLIPSPARRVSNSSARMADSAACSTATERGWMSCKESVSTSANVGTARWSPFAVSSASGWGERATNCAA
jgi:hypothetical protein